MIIKHQIIVVGGGPAGLNAAKYAANAGCDVGLIDSGARLGGQFWRHTGNADLDQSMHHDFDQGSLLIDAIKANPRITIYLANQIWSASVVEDTVVLRTKEHVFQTHRLILATGAYDRSLPFPGWDIPGVMTAGAAQSLLKGNGVIAGKKIVVAGTGPFLLPVVAGISSHGGDIVGVIEASNRTAWVSEITTLIRNPAKILEGFGYFKTLRNNTMRIRFGQAVVAAHPGKDGLLESVTIANIDGDFNIKSTYSLKCDVAAISWGFTPDTSLASALKIKQTVDAQGAVVVEVNSEQRAVHPNNAIEIYAAGESTGIGGSEIALLEGALAGLAAAHSTKNSSQLQKLRRRAQKFANALAKVYPVADGWKSWLTPQTLICRCEEVTFQEVNEARHQLGAKSPRDVKSLTRCGMGMCQGRICGRSISDLFDGGEVERIQTASRPIITPITLGELAQEGLL